tara:strand:- start:1258 stop:2865 length:1608 start_codon:yes stop_codon:yes gene_type:complete
LRLYFFFLSSWFISIVIGLFVLFPNSDDIFYVLPALNFSEYQVLGIFFGDNFTWKIFFNLPTFSFFQGLIFFLYKAINLPIDFYSYRLSNGIIVLLLIFLFSYYLFYINKKNHKENNLIVPVIFIGSLGLIPFAQAWIIFRPEPMGLLFIILGLWFYEFNVFKNKFFNVIFGSLFVGLAPALHPVFALISFSIILINFCKLFFNKLYINILLLIFFSSLPLLILIFFLTLISPEYIEVINDQSSLAIDETMAILGLIDRSIGVFSYQINWKVKIASIYYLFYFLIVIFSFISFVFSIRKIIVLKKIDFTTFTYLGIIFSSLVSLFVFYDHINIHNPLGVLLLFSLLGINVEYINGKFSIISKKTTSIIFLILLLAPLSWSLLNYFKLEFFHDKYSNPFILSDILVNKIDRTIPLYVISHEAAPLIIDQLKNPDLSKTYWLFPGYGTVYIDKNETRFIESFIQDKVIGKNSYWLTREENNKSQGFKRNEDDSICIYIPRSYKQEKIYSIKVLESKVVHKSDKYSVIKGYNYSKDCE